VYPPSVYAGEIQGWEQERKTESQVGLGLYDIGTNTQLRQGLVLLEK